MNPFAALSLRPGNRKNAMALITMIAGVGLVVLFEACRWDRSTLWAALGLLGFTQGAHAASNVASKRAQPTRAEPVWMTDGDAERIAARVREVYEGDIEGILDALIVRGAAKAATPLEPEDDPPIRGPVESDISLIRASEPHA